MGAPYSQDLRLRVVGSIDGGMSKMDAHKTFRVSRSTIDDWLKQRAAVGHVEVRPHLRRGPAPKMADLGAFEAFALRHQEKTLSGMAQQWQRESGQSVSGQTLSSMMQKIGWTRKKRVSSTPSV